MTQIAQKDKTLPFFELFVTNEGKDVNAKVKNWRVTHYDSRNIKVKVDFADPMLISQEDDEDWLIMSISMSQFKDTDGNYLPESLVKSQMIERQAPS